MFGFKKHLDRSSKAAVLRCLRDCQVKLLICSLACNMVAGAHQFQEFFENGQLSLIYSGSGEGARFPFNCPTSLKKLKRPHIQGRRSAALRNVAQHENSRPHSGLDQAIDL